MAKGNDGNYLQHCIEVEAAEHLAEMDAAGRLHIALTHGMKPFEKFKPFEQRQQRSPYYQLLKNKLEDAKKPPQAGEPAVVKAYRKKSASDAHYPNSAELLRAVIGAENLSGGITELCSKKYKCLSAAWFDTNVKTACCSWRRKINADDILACPVKLQTPWLFSMDPMSYIACEHKYKDDNYLHRNDIDILSTALSRYFSSGRPGVASLFVYNVGVQNDNEQSQFVNFIKELKKQIVCKFSEYHAVAISFYSLPHLDGNRDRKRNLAGLLHSPQIDLSSKLKSARIEIGIVP